MLETVGAGRAGWPPSNARRGSALLDLDPDLGRFLSRSSRAAAQQDLKVRVVRLRRGPWAVETLSSVHAANLGLLLLDGLVGREVLAEDVASMELLGPGDLLRPWNEPAEAHLLRAAVRWSALADARLAILDRHVAAQLGRHPEIYAVLMERCTQRCQRLALTQAISQLNRVDRRVLTLLWHLADRWGRSTDEGVVVPLALSHRMLAQLVGARRPTVSTALGELVRAGEVVRGQGGTWMLTGTPVGAPDGHSRFIPPRRVMLAVP
jgi:CRP-like cAMP-binding protein